MIKRKPLLAVFVLLICFYAFSSSGESDEIHNTIEPGEPETPLFELSISAGCGFYVGSFLDHLQSDGAYTVTPVLDIYFSSYIVSFFGLQVQLGGGCVIHPRSEPMEGVILYLGVGPFFEAQINIVTLKFWADIGYQQPTMTLQWYGSGFIEIGGGTGIDIDQDNGVFLGVSYRFQILQSIIIHEQYDSISENDNLSSVSVFLGWLTRW